MEQKPALELYSQIVNPLIRWYEENARVLPWREDGEPYHVWLSEIMLQQTRVEAVKGYYSRFLQALPTIAELAAVEDDRLMKLWEGLGYYNRARNLKKAAQVIIQQYKGIFPGDYNQILDLPGIGAYTAGAVCSICFNQPTPAVDGNVLRVMARITEDWEPIEKPAMKKRVTEALAEVYPDLAGQQCFLGENSKFTQSLMELGATVCIPNGEPKCAKCPVQNQCLAYAHGTWKQLPVRMPKKSRKIQLKTVFILECGEKIAVAKRPADGLLAGLWELPNTEGWYEVQEAVNKAAEWNTKPADVLQQTSKNHIFTHIEWRMRCYYIRCQAEAEQFTWISKKDLEQEIALPTAFKQFFGS